MRESPRVRRLRSDHKALVELAAESTIFEFGCHGDPPELYALRFKGKGIYRPEGWNEVRIHNNHEVHVRLGAAYPRMMPELAWKTPIFHPNISASGVVCLGGYGTYWVPSLTLDELCTMLWDMIRYENYDEKSPYNREAAAWVKHQTMCQLPLDPRPLRDKLAGYDAPIVADLIADSPPKSRKDSTAGRPPRPVPTTSNHRPATPPRRAEPEDAGVIFLDDRPALRPAPAASREEGGILFIE